MSYFTEGDLENFIIQDIDNTLSAWISSVISQVETYIEKYTGIDFENSTSGDRYFDGFGDDVLHIGDYQSITAVTVLNVDGSTMETLTVDVDYVLYPYNESVKNGLLLIPGGKRSQWPDWRRAVKVTGTFGYATPPADIKLAALKLAAEIINEGLKGGQVSSESLGSYSVSYKQVDEKAKAMGIMNILDQYRPITLLA